MIVNEVSVVVTGLVTDIIISDPGLIPLLMRPVIGSLRICSTLPLACPSWRQIALRDFCNSF